MHNNRTVNQFHCSSLYRCKSVSSVSTIACNYNITMPAHAPYQPHDATLCHLVTGGPCRYWWRKCKMQHPYIPHYLIPYLLPCKPFKALNSIWNGVRRVQVTLSLCEVIFTNWLTRSHLSLHPQWGRVLLFANYFNCVYITEWCGL